MSATTPTQGAGTPPPAIDQYRLMARIRAFEEVCAQGVVSGAIHGEMHLAIGHEAIAAAMVPALRDDDALVATHRGHHHAIAKGVPVRELMAEVFEKEAGLCHGRGGHMHLFDPLHGFSTTGIVGAGLPVALGYAYAAVLEQRDRIAVGVTGDGGANHGTFFECLNIASAWNLPLVLLVENNELGISVPFGDVSGTETVAERAEAFGAWHERVDGTDVAAVTAAFTDAVSHARSGAGPALLEATCYRFRGHYEGDPDHYRSAAERDSNIGARDPITRTRSELLQAGAHSEEDLDEIIAAAESEMADLLAEIQREPAPVPHEFMRYAYVEGAE